MRTYRPRRANKRWLKKAPDYIMSCHDNKGKTCDRYTIFFLGKCYPVSGCPTNEVMGLGMSENPTSPIGFCQSFTCPSNIREKYGKKIKWTDLPEQIRNTAINWYERD